MGSTEMSTLSGGKGRVEATSKTSNSHVNNMELRNLPAVHYTIQQTKIQETRYLDTSKHMKRALSAPF